MRGALSPISAVLLALSAASCSPGPRQLVAGEDACRYCRMTIDDVRYGAMVITATGRVETFDAVECLASYVAAMRPDAPPRGIYVANYDTPSQWVAVQDARFLHRSRLRSPMGRELAAFDPAVPVAALRERFGGDIIGWDQVLVLMQQEQFAPVGAIAADSAHTAVPSSPHHH